MNNEYINLTLEGFTFKGSFFLFIFWKDWFSNLPTLNYFPNVFSVKCVKIEVELFTLPNNHSKGNIQLFIFPAGQLACLYYPSCALLHVHSQFEINFLLLCRPSPWRSIIGSTFLFALYDSIHLGIKSPWGAFPDECFSANHILSVSIYKFT